MARPIKNGIDYFPLDVDIFSDDKIVPVSVEYGIKGEIILIRLLCAIYRNGYYILWSDRLRYKLAKEMPSISSELLDSVVERLVKWGFFDAEIYKLHGVLTSKGIQERYFSAIRKRRRRRIASEPFIITDAEDIKKPAPPASNPIQKLLDAPKMNITECNADWLNEFFADNHKEQLTSLCKNFSLGAGKINILRSIAEAVIAEWELSKTTHADYSDWSRHLISCMRIKSREFRPAKQAKENKPMPVTPSPEQYTYGGGFGGKDI